MAQLLKDMLVKPYIEVAFDVDDKIRIPVTWSDCKRFVDQWPKVSKQLAEVKAEEDPKALLDAERKLMELMCAGSGDVLMDKCLAYLKDGTDLPDEQVSLGVFRVLEYVAGLWMEQAKRMGEQHGEHVESYLRDVDDDAI